MAAISPGTTPRDLVLLVPEKLDAERDAVAGAWEHAGGTVIRVGRFWDPPPVQAERARVYGHDTFCLVLAEKLGLELVSPPDEILAEAEHPLLQRTLRIAELREVGATAFPAFVKPVAPKQFRAGVHQSIESLAQETQGLSPQSRVIVSEVVQFSSEARAFVLDGVVTTCAVYEGEGDPVKAATFAEHAAQTLHLPRTCVVDVGLLDGDTWALVECNATWGAGLNGCDAFRVIGCIAAASRAMAPR